jgi:hypothetical protein
VDLELALGETPQEIPLNDPTLLYNKIMMDLRQQADGYPGTEASAFAQLNLALCAMHFGDYAAAHDYLMKAKNILPQRPGLSQGTALYYLGLSREPRHGVPPRGGRGLSRGRRLQGRDAVQQRRTRGRAAGRAPRRELTPVASLPARLVWMRGDGSTVDFALSKPVMLVGRDPEADIALTRPGAQPRLWRASCGPPDWPTNSTREWRGGGRARASPR